MSSSPPAPHVPWTPDQTKFEVPAIPEMPSDFLGPPRKVRELTEEEKEQLKSRFNFEDAHEVVRFNSTVRIYPNGGIVIKWTPREKYAGYRQKHADGALSQEDRYIKTACWRAKQDIFDLAFANHWDYFVTMTLDKVKVDRYNYGQIVPKLETFTSFLYRHHCKWLIVPELHKDGAFHFHGLIQGHLEGKYRETKWDKQGKPYDCYSIVGYNLGRSDISPVKDQSRVSSYMTKYVTKELLRTVPKGRKRFWASRSLQRPKIERAEFTAYELDSLSASAQYQSTHTDLEGNAIVTLVL